MHDRFRQDDAVDALWLVALLSGGLAYIFIDLTVGLAGVIRLLAE